MRLRPQFQLRLRSAEQFASVSDSAARAGVSMNEWILGRVENGRTGRGGGGRSSVVEKDANEDGRMPSGRKRTSGIGTTSSRRPQVGGSRAALGRVAIGAQPKVVESSWTPNGDSERRDVGRTEGVSAGQASVDAQDLPPMPLCPSCEEPLVASGGKLYCANQACGICGVEQKARRVK
jgi:hypothetical protein